MSSTCQGTQGPLLSTPPVPGDFPAWIPQMGCLAPGVGLALAMEGIGWTSDRDEEKGWVSYPLTPSLEATVPQSLWHLVQSVSSCHPTLSLSDNSTTSCGVCVAWCHLHLSEFHMPLAYGWKAECTIMSYSPLPAPNSMTWNMYFSINSVFIPYNSAKVPYWFFKHACWEDIFIMILISG